MVFGCPSKPGSAPLEPIDQDPAVKKAWHAFTMSNMQQHGERLITDLLRAIASPEDSKTTISLATIASTQGGLLFHCLRLTRSTMPAFALRDLPLTLLVQPSRRTLACLHLRVTAVLAHALKRSKGSLGMAWFLFFELLRLVLLLVSVEQLVETRENR